MAHTPGPRARTLARKGRTPGTPTPMGRGMLALAALSAAPLALMLGVWGALLAVAAIVALLRWLQAPGPRERTPLTRGQRMALLAVAMLGIVILTVASMLGSGSGEGQTVSPVATGVGPYHGPWCAYVHRGAALATSWGGQVATLVGPWVGP